MATHKGRCASACSHWARAPRAHNATSIWSVPHCGTREDTKLAGDGAGNVLAPSVTRHRAVSAGTCLPMKSWSCQLHEEALPRKKGRILVERDKPGQTEFHLLLAESVSVLSLLPLEDVISYKVIWYKMGPGFWSMLDQKIWEFSFSTNKQEFFFI